MWTEAEHGLFKRRSWLISFKWPQNLCLIVSAFSVNTHMWLGWRFSLQLWQQKGEDFHGHLHCPKGFWLAPLACSLLSLWQPGRDIRTTVYVLQTPFCLLSWNEMLFWAQWVLWHRYATHQTLPENKGSGPRLRADLILHVQRCILTWSKTLWNYSAPFNHTENYSSPNDARDQAESFLLLWSLGTEADIIL